MNNAILLLLAVSLHGVAGEVGAPNPQPELSANNNPVAVISGETGANAKPAAQPYTVMANDEELQNFENLASKLDTIVNESLEVALSERVDMLLSGRSERLYISAGHF